MPYIKAEDRYPYNRIIWKIQRALDADDKEILKLFESALIQKLKTQDVKAIDGHFNYFITKLMKDLGWHDGRRGYFGTVGSPTYTLIHDFIYNVAKEVYSPKYFNYNRLIGMLACCREEFIRRFKKQATSVDMLLSNLIKKFYYEVIGPYEDSKIRANGDVE